MEDNEQDYSLEDRLDEVQHDNQLRNDTLLQEIGAAMEGARRSDDSSISSGLKPLPKSNSSLNSNGKGGLPTNSSFEATNKGSSNGFTNAAKNVGSGIAKNAIGGKGNSGNLGSSLSTGKNNGKNSNAKGAGNNLKQKAQVAAMTKALSAVHPAAAAAANSKLGQAILSALAKKHSMAKGKGIVDKFLPTGNEKTDSDGKTESEKSKENSLEKVAMVILSPKAKLLIPIGIACCVVLFGVCIIMVTAQVQSSVYGMDASSSVADDSKDVQDNLTKNEGKMADDHVDSEITD